MTAVLEAPQRRMKLIARMTRAAARSWRAC
jgi:hypothetical protein